MRAKTACISIITMTHTKTLELSSTKTLQLVRESKLDMPCHFIPDHYKSGKKLKSFAKILIGQKCSERLS